MNYVAIAAHPDDIDLLCGGTLLRLGEGAHELTIVVVSDGSRGAADGRTGQEIASVREGEGRAASKLLGADYRNLGFVDGELVDTIDMRAAIVSELRRTRAEVVMTLAPDDYSSDHIAVSRAATAACQHAGAAGFVEGGERLPDIPALYYMEPVCGGATEPTLYVDVTAVFERKLEVLACHQSQFELISASYGVDLINLAKIAGAWRGLQSRVRYAESFTASSSWPRRHVGVHLPN